MKRRWRSLDVPGTNASRPSSSTHATFPSPQLSLGSAICCDRARDERTCLRSLETNRTGLTWRDLHCTAMELLVASSENCSFAKISDRVQWLSERRDGFVSVRLAGQCSGGRIVTAGVPGRELGDAAKSSDSGGGLPTPDCKDALDQSRGLCLTEGLQLFTPAEDHLDLVRRSPVNRTRLPMMCGAVIAFNLGCSN